MKNSPSSVWVHGDVYSSPQNLGTTVLEQDKQSQPVVYDHTGQPWVKPRPAVGFDLSGKK